MVNSFQPASSFAERVRDARTRMDLTQVQFAERMAGDATHGASLGRRASPVRALLRSSGCKRWRRRRRIERPLILRRQRAALSRPTFLWISPGTPAAVLLVRGSLPSGARTSVSTRHSRARLPGFDPLPHQRIAVYERMLPQEPLRFLLADDAGAGKTIMTGLYMREMLFRRRIRRVLIVPPAGLVGQLGSGSFAPFSGCNAALSPDRIAEMAQTPSSGTDGDRVIVSLDTLVTERVFRALRSPGVGTL